MKPFTISLFLSLLLTGCVAEPVLRQVALNVSPADTLTLPVHAPFHYDLRVTSDANPIYGAFVTITDPFDSQATVSSATDQNGSAVYDGVVDRVSDTLLPITFVATRSGLGSSEPIVRFIRVLRSDTLQLSASIVAHGILPDSSIVAEPVVPEETLHTRASIPFLPYVFFANNAASIDNRYNRDPSFTMNAMIGKDALDANHSALPIIGLRLQQNPGASVTITGTNSNTGEEKGNINLSKARATTVADYLAVEWGIDRSRMAIQERNLPELPTNPVTRAGIEENRRVEISSGDTAITAPIIVESREAVSIETTQVLFTTQVTPDPSRHSYAQWTISIDYNGQLIAPVLSGKGAPPTEVSTTIPEAARYLNQPVHYTLDATDASGVTARADGYTRIVPRTIDRENLERYAMVAFPFDRSDIDQHARQMLELIAESIRVNCIGLKIDGFCDATGTPEYNQALSEARANTSVTTLRTMTTLPANVTVHGHGLRDPKFTNDLPEGRQLNRRVEFTIEKSPR